MTKYLNLLKKNCSGFTLVELLVSITIIAIIASLSIANYKKGGTATDLKMVTQDIVSEVRKVQGYALGSKEFNGLSPAGGWGISFSEGSSELVIFADDGDRQYSNSEIFLKRKFSISEKVIVSDIILNSNNRSHFYLVYEPPDPDVFMGVNDVPGSPLQHITEIVGTIVLSHKDNPTETKEIIVNKFGLIDAN